jgi:hypothetical protein
MSNVRRFYIYLACIASLEAVAWAVISLLRNLLVPGKYTSLENTALQIATIVVGLPIFVVHWLWAQRLARRDRQERGAAVRRLYLYGAMALFLGSLIPNAFDLLDGLLRFAFGLRPEAFRYPGLSQAAVFVHHLVAMAVLALLTHDLLTRLHRELLGLDIQVFDATAADTPAALAQAHLIVGPWSALVAGDEVARALAASPASKVLLLTQQEGWHWAGAGKQKAQNSLRQAVRAVKEFSAGKEIRANPG